jgi:hypothetical protein
MNPTHAGRQDDLKESGDLARSPRFREVAGDAWPIAALHNTDRGAPADSGWSPPSGAGR